MGESGTRRISSVIEQGVDSYWINRDLIQDSDRYGSFLNLNADGTFTSWNTAPCGNDCFYRSHGTFKKMMKHIYVYKSIHPHNRDIVQVEE